MVENAERIWMVGLCNWLVLSYEHDAIYRKKVLGPCGRHVTIIVSQIQ